MSRHLLSILAYVAAPLLAATSPGCMLIGYGIGAAIDASASIDPPAEASAADLASIQVGDTVDVISIDGTHVGQGSPGHAPAGSAADTVAYARPRAEQSLSARDSLPYPLRGDPLHLIPEESLLSMRAGDRLLKYDDINLWSPGVGVHGRTMFASPDTVYVPKVDIEASNTSRGSNLQARCCDDRGFHRCAHRCHHHHRKRRSRMRRPVSSWKLPAHRGSRGWSGMLRRLPLSNAARAGAGALACRRLDEVGDAKSWGLAIGVGAGHDPGGGRPRRGRSPGWPSPSARKNETFS